MRDLVYITAKLFHSRLQLLPLSQLCLQQAHPRWHKTTTLHPSPSHLKPWVGQLLSLEGMGALLAQRLKLPCQRMRSGILWTLSALALALSPCDSLDAEQCTSPGNPGINSRPSAPHLLVLSLTSGAHPVCGHHAPCPQEFREDRQSTCMVTSLCCEPEQTVPLSSRHETGIHLLCHPKCMSSILSSPRLP